MSSETGGVAAAVPVCRIGERAFLVAAEGARDFEASFNELVTRSLDLNVEGRQFRAYQMADALDDGLDPGEWNRLDLSSFSALCELNAIEHGKLVTTVFRLVAQTFNLKRDAILRASFDAFLAGDGIPRGRIAAYAIDDIDTIVCEVPNRLRMSAGNLVIAYDDHLVLGSVKAVASVIGDENDRKLAVIDCSRHLPAGRALVVTQRGLVAADIDIRSSSDIRAYAEEATSTLPDFANLLAIWDSPARAGLGALSRREESTPFVAMPSLGFHFQLTHVFSMDHGLFISGWFADPDNLLEEAWVVDHGLSSHALTQTWKVLPAKTTIEGSERPVLNFHAFIPRQEAIAAPSSLAVRLQLSNGESHVAYAANCRFDRLATRTGILDSATGRSLPPETLAEVFEPAVQPIQQALNEEQAVRERIDFGTASKRKVSLIIPLYRELRFIRSQLVAFNADDYVRANCQIVYAVDDPLIANRVRQIIGGIGNVYRLDVRVIILARNGGYALANNLAAAEADGESVVLMNSDIIPEAPGWLDPMLSRHAALPACSVIGPKLLYADESLQHAGMYFSRTPNGYWQNMHFFKGWGRGLPAANLEREVPAVTGALMLLSRRAFLDVGGFTPDYVIGDYEDSDLCLKLRAKGGTCLYMPSVALYHFERQSMTDSDVDLGSTIYNRAMHSARWSEKIVSLMSAHDGEVRYGV